MKPRNNVFWFLQLLKVLFLTPREFGAEKDAYNMCLVKVYVVFVLVSLHFFITVQRDYVSCPSHSEK